MTQPSIGVDIGGTKVAAGVLVGETLLNLETLPTPSSGASAVLSAVGELLEKLLRQCPGAPVGIGVPGPLDKERQKVRFAPNIYGFRDVPVIGALRERLGDVPITMDNDARVAALAEARLGAARGSESSLYVTVSTGIGSGLVLGGRLWRGFHGIAGEIGHVMALPGGAVSGAGLDGSLEAVASGSARDVSYAMQREVSTQEAFALAQEGQPQAERAVKQAMHRIGIALADAQKILDPEVMVIGGGVASNASFFDEVHAAAQEYGGPFAVPELRPAELGSAAGVIGAALLAREDEFTAL